MPNKRYTAFNRQNLILVAKMPGTDRQMSIEFTGGYGMSNEAYFLTNDIDIQNMLESDHRYNEKFRLTEIDNMDIAEYNARKEIKETKKDVVTETKVEKKVVDENPSVETPIEKVAKKRETFTNLQDARNYFNSEYNVPFHLISNKQKLKEKAVELGVNIILESDNKK